MPITILLADDSRTIQTAVGIALALEPVTLVKTASGAEALAKAREIKPHIAVVDHSLPDQSGYDVAAAIKQIPSCAHIPVLILSSQLHPYDDAKGKVSGASGFIQKPFQCQTFVDTLKATLQTARQQLHLQQNQPVEGSHKETPKEVSTPSLASPAAAVIPTTTLPAMPPSLAAKPIIPDAVATQPTTAQAATNTALPPTIATQPMTPASQAALLSSLPPPPPSYSPPMPAVPAPVASPTDFMDALDVDVVDDLADEPLSPLPELPPLVDLPPLAELPPLPALPALAPEEPLSMPLLSQPADFLDPLDEPVLPQETAAPINFAPTTNHTDSAAYYQEYTTSVETSATSDTSTQHTTPANVSPPAPAADTLAVHISEKLSEQLSGHFADVAAQALPSTAAVIASSPTLQEDIDSADDANQDKPSVLVSGLSRDELRDIARGIIEQVAWEVIPELAETIIREELDRLLRSS